MPLDLELELIVVDDGSSDGSWEELQRVAGGDPRIRIFRHDRNRGKGAAIRTAIGQMTGDVAVVQDADLEYDPNDYLRLLAPIRDGRADAVFGSRFAGETHRVLYFWHSVGNKLLTMLANMVNDVNLTDMETCYKMVRADVLRQLRLQQQHLHLGARDHLPPGPMGRGSTKCPSATPAAPTWKERRSRPSTASRSLGSCSAAAGSTRSSPITAGSTC